MKKIIPFDKTCLKDLLDNKLEQFNKSCFVDDDPVSVPHRFQKPEDIEIAAFLTSLICWGQRKTIIKNAASIMKRMDDAPHDFIINAGSADMGCLKGFVHRTFNDGDLLYFINFLKHLYRHGKGLRGMFYSFYQEKKDIREVIIHVRQYLFQVSKPGRTRKHFPDIAGGSAAKKVNLFLKWMVRKDHTGIDFGLWNDISPADLYIPLDIHVGNVARQLDITRRKQNNWKTVEEITNFLRILDPHDPLKYDIALFCMGEKQNTTG